MIEFPPESTKIKSVATPKHGQQSQSAEYQSMQWRLNRRGHSFRNLIDHQSGGDATSGTSLVSVHSEDTIVQNPQRILLPSEQKTGSVKVLSTFHRDQIFVAKLKGNQNGASKSWHSRKDYIRSQPFAADVHVKNLESELMGRQLKLGRANKEGDSGIQGKYWMMYKTIRKFKLQTTKRNLNLWNFIVYR